MLKLLYYLNISVLSGRDREIKQVGIKKKDGLRSSEIHLTRFPITPFADIDLPVADALSHNDGHKSG
jgi:hypothetical protein